MAKIYQGSVAISGGGGEKELFVVHFDYDGNADNIASADKDQLEIDAALAEGKVVIGMDRVGYYTLVKDLRGSGYGNTYTFVNTDYSNGYYEYYEMYGGGVLWGQIDLANACGVSSHNTNSAAHEDIRTTANEALTSANEAKTAADNKAPMYAYGTEDLTAGSSPLETGKLYFVYE